MKQAEGAWLTTATMDTAASSSTQQHQPQPQQQHYQQPSDECTATSLRLYGHRKWLEDTISFLEDEEELIVATHAPTSVQGVQKGPVSCCSNDSSSSTTPTHTTLEQANILSPLRSNVTSFPFGDSSTAHFFTPQPQRNDRFISTEATRCGSPPIMPVSISDFNTIVQALQHTQALTSPTSEPQFRQERPPTRSTGERRGPKTSSSQTNTHHQYYPTDDVDQLVHDYQHSQQPPQMVQPLHQYAHIEAPTRKLYLPSSTSATNDSIAMERSPSHLLPQQLHASTPNPQTRADRGCLSYFRRPASLPRPVPDSPLSNPPPLNSRSPLSASTTPPVVPAVDPRLFADPYLFNVGSPQNIHQQYRPYGNRDLDPRANLPPPRRLWPQQQQMYQQQDHMASQRARARTRGSKTTGGKARQSGSTEPVGNRQGSGTGGISSQQQSRNRSPQQRDKLQEQQRLQLQVNRQQQGSPSLAVGSSAAVQVQSVGGNKRVGNLKTAGRSKGKCESSSSAGGSPLAQVSAAVSSNAVMIPATSANSEGGSSVAPVFHECKFTEGDVIQMRDMLFRGWQGNAPQQVVNGETGLVLSSSFYPTAYHDMVAKIILFCYRCLRVEQLVRAIEYNEPLVGLVGFTAHQTTSSHFFSIVLDFDYLPTEGFRHRGCETLSPSSSVKSSLPGTKLRQLADGDLGREEQQISSNRQQRQPQASHACSAQAQRSVQYREGSAPSSSNHPSAPDHGQAEFVSVPPALEVSKPQRKVQMTRAQVPASLSDSCAGGLLDGEGGADTTEFVTRLAILVDEQDWEWPEVHDAAAAAASKKRCGSSTASGGSGSVGSSKDSGGACVREPQQVTRGLRAPRMLALYPSIDCSVCNSLNILYDYWASYNFELPGLEEECSSVLELSYFDGSRVYYNDYEDAEDEMTGPSGTIAALEMRQPDQQDQNDLPVAGPPSMAGSLTAITSTASSRETGGSIQPQIVRTWLPFCCRDVVKMHHRRLRRDAIFQALLTHRGTQPDIVYEVKTVKLPPSGATDLAGMMESSGSGPDSSKSGAGAAAGVSNVKAPLLASNSSTVASAETSVCGVQGLYDPALEVEPPCVYERRYYRLIDGEVVEEEGYKSYFTKIHAFKNYYCNKHKLWFSIDLFKSEATQDEPHPHEFLSPAQASSPASSAADTPVASEFYGATSPSISSSAFPAAAADVSCVAPQSSTTAAQKHHRHRMRMNPFSHIENWEFIEEFFAAVGFDSSTTKAAAYVPPPTMPPASKSSGSACVAPCYSLSRAATAATVKSTRVQNC